MKTLDEVRDIMKERDMRELRIANIPTWIDKGQTEGIAIDFRNNVVRTFWVKDGERVLGEPASDKITKTVETIKNKGNTETKETKQEVPETVDTEKVIEKVNGVLVPETMNLLLLEKWKKMSTFERILMFQKTAPEYVKQKPKGKKMISYVEGNLMQQEANIAFLFNWSDKIEGFHFSDESVACYGSVTAEVDNCSITHSAVGVDRQEYTGTEKKPIFSEEELMKNAHTDMIKKALSKFGFNNDVYRGEV